MQWSQLNTTNSSNTVVLTESWRTVRCCWSQRDDLQQQKPQLVNVSMAAKRCTASLLYSCYHYCFLMEVLFAF